MSFLWSRERAWGVEGVGVLCWLCEQLSMLGRLGEWRVGGVKRPRLRFTKEKSAVSRLSAVNCTVTILASKQRMSLRHGNWIGINEAASCSGALPSICGPP